MKHSESRRGECLAVQAILCVRIIELVGKGVGKGRHTGARTSSPCSRDLQARLIALRVCPVVPTQETEPYVDGVASVSSEGVILRGGQVRIIGGREILAEFSLEAKTRECTQKQKQTNDPQQFTLIQ